MSDYIGDIASLAKTQSTTATKSKSSSTSLDMEDFLQMMVAQFQNQDPENAASTTDMLNQMVQMSMIQAITNITDAVSLSYSASLVGKEVTVGSYDSKGNVQEIVGTVTGTGTYNGSPVVFVDGVSYNMSSIMAIGRLPAAEDSKDPPVSQDPEDSTTKT
ncbi:flagellar hook capping protein FlgD [Oscillibacter valericigenes Sjm18-20]|nr:flagellar hook capping protein FlgD [Oscillibacter valericigenes Sjm18-20]